MNDKRILKNIGISMLMQPISMILSFVYTPLALAFLGDAKYGVWAIILNVVSWISYFDIGIGNGLRNNLAQAYTRGDEEEAQTYVSTAYFGTTIISAVFFLVVAFAWTALNLSDFFKLNAPGENSNLIVVVSVFFVCVNFVLSMSKTSAYAVQQPALISILGAFTQVLQIVIILVLSRIMHENLMAVALMYGCANLTQSFMLYFLLKRKYPFLQPKIKKIDLQYIKPLLTLGMGFFVMQICSLVLNTTSNLLISNLYGSEEVTPYSMVFKVFNLIVQVHGIIIMPMWSAYTEAAERKDMAWIKSTMRKIDMITLLFSVGAIIGIFLFEPLAAIWLGRRLEYGSALIVIVAIYMIVQMFANNYSSFLCGVGDIKVSVIVSAVGAVLNIPLSIFFAQVMNLRLPGIILGSLCVMLIGLIVLPIVARRWIVRHEKEWGRRNEST